MVGLDLPLGHVQNGNENQKFISMKTKSHSYHDFDSSLPHDNYDSLRSHPISIPIPTYQMH